MISLPWVKNRVIALLGAEAVYDSVSVLYGMPEKDKDLSGSSPLYRQSFGFDNPEGLYRVDEMCGPDRQEYFEGYDLDAVIQVIGRSRDATAAVVEARLALLQWTFLQTLQDATLGLGGNPNPMISDLYIEATDVEVMSGWLPASGINQAATRCSITLHLEAKINVDS